MPKHRSLLARQTPFRPFLRPLVMALAVVAAAPAHADKAGALRSALAEARTGDWAGAEATVEDPISGDIIEWFRLRAGDATLGDYEAFLERRPDWPGRKAIRIKGEEAVARSTTPERVIAYFAEAQPATAKGAMALIKAFAATGNIQAAQAEAMRAWIALSFTMDQEDELLAMYSKALAQVNEQRLDRLLWDGDTDEAARMLPRVSAGWAALGRARIALRVSAPSIDVRLKAVPAKLSDNPGLAYERFLWRMRKDRYEDAADTIIAASASDATLGQPEEWAERRALLARRLLRDGDPRTAYKVASSHHLTGGADYAELEFVSGFIALRSLHDYGAALSHFRNLTASVSTPISVSRGAYWEGRSYEAMGKQAEARAAYARAAKFQSAYYGLLAAERIGADLDPKMLGKDRSPDWRQAPFAKSSVLAAALLLEKAGDKATAKRFFVHLADGLDPPELAQLAELALDIDNPHVAVVVAKEAADRGVILPRAYFPVTGMVPDGLPVSRALALSIARRESEFDPTVVSSAGARGLMQLMPETAKRMASQTGQSFVASKLTSDPDYNASLGSAYLAQMVDQFGPSVALIASAYNAGPGRPKAWMEQLGDPRREDVDVVDWVEMIPFKETRTYVMRVSEAVVVYRAKLKGKVGPVNITGELKG